MISEYGSGGTVFVIRPAGEGDEISGLQNSEIFMVEVTKVLHPLVVTVTLLSLHQKAPRVVPATAWPYPEAACA